MNETHTQFSGLITILLVLLLGGCDGSTKPPRIYTAAATGPSRLEALVEQFNKAHLARDVDAAMRLIYWQPAVDQEFWWASLSDEFENPYDTIETLPAEGEHPSPKLPSKTTLPVVARIRIVRGEPPSSTSMFELLVGVQAWRFWSTLEEVS